MKLMHGSRKPLALHLGLCLTDSREAAFAYARQGSVGKLTVTAVDLPLDGLRVVDVEGFGEGATADAAGDSAEELAALAADGIDVVTYDDEAIGMDGTHRTWRIVSEKAMAACRNIGAVR